MSALIVASMLISSGNSRQSRISLTSGAARSPREHALFRDSAIAERPERHATKASFCSEHTLRNASARGWRRVFLGVRAFSQQFGLVTREGNDWQRGTPAITSISASHVDGVEQLRGSKAKFTITITIGRGRSPLGERHAVNVGSGASSRAICVLHPRQGWGIGRLGRGENRQGAATGFFLLSFQWPTEQAAAQRYLRPGPRAAEKRPLDCNFH